MVREPQKWTKPIPNWKAAPHQRVILFEDIG